MLCQTLCECWHSLSTSYALKFQGFFADNVVSEDPEVPEQPGKFKSKFQKALSSELNMFKVIFRCVVFVIFPAQKIQHMLQV